MLLHLEDQELVRRGDVDVLLGARRRRSAHLDGVVDLGKMVEEDGVDHDALDRLDPADILVTALRRLGGLFCQCHVSSCLGI